MGSTGGSSAAPVGPLDLGSGRTAKAICAGRSHSCAILDDGTVKCWGYNPYGQLGYGEQRRSTRDTGGPRHRANGKGGVMRMGIHLRYSRRR